MDEEQWDLAKVNVQREQLEPVLKRHGCDPDIVARNGPTVFSQIDIHLRIPQRGLFGYVQDANRWHAKELQQLRLVLRPAISGTDPLYNSPKTTTGTATASDRRKTSRTGWCPRRNAEYADVSSNRFTRQLPSLRDRFAASRPGLRRTHPHPH